MSSVGSSTPRCRASPGVRTPPASHRQRLRGRRHSDLGRRGPRCCPPVACRPGRLGRRRSPWSARRARCPAARPGRRRAGGARPGPPCDGGERRGVSLTAGDEVDEQPGSGLPRGRRGSAGLEDDRDRGLLAGRKQGAVQRRRVPRAQNIVHDRDHLLSLPTPPVPGSRPGRGTSASCRRMSTTAGTTLTSSSPQPERADASARRREGAPHLGALVAASEAFTPADIGHASHKVAQATFEATLTMGGRVRAGTADYLRAVQQTRPTLDAAAIAQFGATSRTTSGSDPRPQAAARTRRAERLRQRREVAATGPAGRRPRGRAAPEARSTSSGRPPSTCTGSGTPAAAPSP